MRYLLQGFNQAKLVEYGLNDTDALILRWFVDFLPKMSKITHEGTSYYWVKYQQVIEDLPAMEITNREVIARRFNKLVDAGIMNKFLNKAAGNFTTFSLTDKYHTLIDYKVQNSTQKLEPFYSDAESSVDYKAKNLTEKLEPFYPNAENSLDSKVETKDSSIKETSLLNNIPPYIPHGEKAEGEVEFVQKTEKEKNQSLATEQKSSEGEKLVEEKATKESPMNCVANHPFNQTPIPVHKMPLLSKHVFSDDAREMGYEAWLDVIHKYQVEFTEFELSAIKAYAFSKPNLPIHIIQSNVSLLEKWALEGLDIENSLRQSLSTRSLIQPCLRREFDSQNNRIYDVKRLNAIRQNVIIKEQKQPEK